MKSFLVLFFKKELLEALLFEKRCKNFLFARAGSADADPLQPYFIEQFHRFVDRYAMQLKAILL